jgi:hypothetical protein
VKKSILLALLALVSCTSIETPRPSASPSGPPAIEADAVEAHARQFAEELPDRVAGSQQEFAGTTYITAHLQQAGYVVEFDSIPVENTVRSTNVVALPPSTQDPVYLVASPYDGSGPAPVVGAFLELARALRASVPEHSVEFVALGAEESDIPDGPLGTRRMIKLLQDRELEPHVIYLANASPSDRQQAFKAYGADADELHTLAYGADAVLTQEMLFRPGSDLFTEAGFDTTLVVGEPARVAQILLRFLASEGAG